MRLLLPFRSLLVAVFRFLKSVVVEDLATRSSSMVRRIGAIERGEVRASAEEVEKILLAMPCSKAEVIVVMACLEALHAQDPLLDPETAAAQERLIADRCREMRRRMRAPGIPEPHPYPPPYLVSMDRLEAGESWECLSEVETLAGMTSVVRFAREYQRWAFVERLCDESSRAASKDSHRALDLAVVAVRVARHLAVWEGWRLRLLGFAAAHLANALRVANHLAAADRTLAAAWRLWESGLDPDQLLDPGRLLDLEASLRRDQRRFAEAIDLLERAAPLTRRPEHVALKAASTLAVMGEYPRVVEVLTGLAPRVARHPERRLRSIQRFNLAVALSHVGGHRQAARLLPALRRLVEGDELDRLRFRWLEGRIEAGLGETGKALAALEEARIGFVRHKLGHDAALALMEAAVIHLERGELAAVRGLTAELAPFFEKIGVHEEALKALRLFEEAVAREAATAELARLLLAWLFRAQHDPGLVFSPPS